MLEIGLLSDQRIYNVKKMHEETELAEGHSGILSIGNGSLVQSAADILLGQCYKIRQQTQ